jgi:hypothetical protein
LRVQEERRREGSGFRKREDERVRGSGFRKAELTISS